MQSPGMKTLRENRMAPTITGEDVGRLYILGIFEWGEVGKPIRILSPTDREKKVGRYLNGFYGAKAIDFAFKQKGISEIFAVRCAHYDNGVLQAKKATKSLQGYNTGEQNRTKVDTLKIVAKAEGKLGDKLNINTVKASTTLASQLDTDATYITVNNTENFEIGDIIDISDGTNYARCIVTSIDTVNKRLYFKALTLSASITTAAAVKTSSNHSVRTAIADGEALTSNAAEINLKNVSNINIGTILTFVDKRTANPNDVTVEVKSISGNKVFFDSIGTITQIDATNSIIVSQEFQLSVFLEETQINKTNFYLSMNPANESRYVENIFKNDYVAVIDEGSTENFIGDIPEAISKVFLSGGDDGLTGLNANDFIGNESLKNGVYGFDALPDRFAQIICPDGRWASVIQAIFNYAENRKLWYEPDFNLDLSPEEAVNFAVNDAMLNSEYGEISYPNLIVKNPYTGINEVIPQSAGVVGLNARIWGKKIPGYGVWKQPAGVTNGIIYGVVALEGEDGEGNYITSNVKIRDLLYKNRINSIIKYEPYGFVKWGIRIAKLNGQFTQIGEAVTFLYCEHSIKNGMPWTVFENIDDDFKTIARSSIHNFLEEIREKGGLKGKTPDKAFDIDLESLNNTETEEKGEFYFRIGLATKKAGEFIYFVFSRKIGGEE